MKWNPADLIYWQRRTQQSEKENLWKGKILDCSMCKDPDSTFNFKHLLECTGLLKENDVKSRSFHWKQHKKKPI